MKEKNNGTHSCPPPKLKPWGSDDIKGWGFSTHTYPHYIYRTAMKTEEKQVILKNYHRYKIISRNELRGKAYMHFKKST